MSFSIGFAKTAAQSLAGIMDEAIIKHNKKLMEKMRSRKPMFSIRDIAKLYPGLRLMKHASNNLALDAAIESNQTLNQENFVPGSTLRGDAETGQIRGKNYRTEFVMNEKRQFGKQFKKHYVTARPGDPTGGTPGNEIRGNTEARG